MPLVCLVGDWLALWFVGCKLGVAVAVIALVRVCSALLACGLWWGVC